MLTKKIIRIISSRKFGKFSEDRSINNKIVNIFSNGNKKKISVNILTKPEERRNIQKKTSRSPHPELTEKPRKRKALIKDLLKSEIITMILIIKNNDRVDISFLSPSQAPPTEISKNPETPEQTHQSTHRIEEKNKTVIHPMFIQNSTEERLTNILQTKTDLFNQPRQSIFIKQISKNQ